MNQSVSSPNCSRDRRPAHRFVPDHRGFWNRLCQGVLRRPLATTIWISSLFLVSPITMWPNSAEAQDQGGFQRPRPVRSAQAKSTTQQVSVEPAEEIDEQKVRLSFFNATWPKVLETVAEKTGSVLVMHDVPQGRFTRRDQKEYSRTEAIRVLNRELEPDGYRLLEKDDFLIVIDLKTTRVRYRRPMIPTRPEADMPQTAQADRTESFPKYERKVQAIASRDGQGTALNSTSGDRSGVLQPASFDEDGSPGPRIAGNAPDQSRSESSESNPTATQSVRKVQKAWQPRQRTAKDLAGLVYRGLKPRSQLINDGPQGLPAFVAYRSEEKEVTVPHSDAQKQSQSKQSRTPQFAVGIDMEQNRLIIEAAPHQVDALIRIFRVLDRHPIETDDAVRLVSGTEQAGRIAQNLQTPLKRLAARQQVAQRDALLDEEEAEDEDFPIRDPFEVEELPPPERPTSEDDEDDGDAPVPPNASDLPDLIRSLRGEVTVESVPDLGIMILRGNEADVEAVMNIIRQIEEEGRGAVPEISLLMLNHVNSQALSELLETVYERLTTLRDRGVQRPETISFIPVVKPNAILILAPSVDMESILDLADELDQPVDPRSEFQVFRLKNAVPGQIVEALEELYPEQEQPGLRARVKAVPDLRTNSVIVQARPRDMEEVAALIRKIDRDDSGAVSRMHIFPLKHALADELAEVINTSIQSVLSPAAPPAVGPAAAPAPGQAAQQLRDAKSVVLEFLATGDGQQQLVRSGILADIRVTADPRTNSLVVSAPEQSMALMKELIRHLDTPSPTVAEIKVFTLAHGDASTMLQLLQSLFAAQAGPQQQLPGIQVVGAEDVSSSLIPLRFSADIRTNSIIAVGGAEALRVVEAILLRLDESDIRQRQNTVVKLKNNPVIPVAQAINDFLTSQRDLALIDPNLVSTTELLEREIIAVPEVVSNSLLISATPRYFDEIMRLVRQLDETPPQVVIQALLVEVELDNTDEFGVELGFQDSILFDRGVIAAENLLTIAQTVTSPNGVQTTTQQIVSQESTPGFRFNNQPLGNNTAIHPSRVGTQGLSNFSVGRVNGDLGFGGLVLSASSESVSILIRALASRRKVHVLSRPQIRALDNQLAQIQVGQQVPIVQGVNVNQLGGASPITTPQEVGIILSVTPRISPDGLIVMETIATKSAVSSQGVPIFTDLTTGTVVESPIIDITQAQTTVSVPNGQTIVMGGMITKTDDTIERKVPWLGDIPILGIPFRFDSFRTRRTELLIFLTPRIVLTDFDSELIKQVEIERSNFIIEDAEEIHGPLLAVPPDCVGPDCPPQTLHKGDLIPIPAEQPLPEGMPMPSIPQHQPLPLPPTEGRPLTIPPSPNGQSIPDDSLQFPDDESVPTTSMPANSSAALPASHSKTALSELNGVTNGESPAERGQTQSNGTFDQTASSKQSSSEKKPARWNLFRSKSQ